jgi:GH24 family phage-related lysozyme (muramidase)
MARDPKRLRKAYEFKIGKDRADKLSDEQINLLSKYYNSLSESEQRDIDAKVFQGRSNELFEMADAFASESQGSVATAAAEPPPPPPKPGGALAIYDGKAGTDLVDEEIDERILRLLGLEEVFDIDYATYLSLLKEKMAAARMTQQQLSTEESELVTNEFRRVRGKVGRFKLKKKVISIDPAAPSVKIKPVKLLKPAKLEKTTSPEETQVTEKKGGKKGADSISKYLEEIIPIVKSIKKILESQLKISTSIRDAETKRLEKERRFEKESELEKKKKANNFLKKLKSTAPQLGIFDAIKRFIVNVLLGKAVLGFLDWMSDPENKKKLDGLGKFISDWWPALTAAFVLFATPLGAFIRGTVGLIGKFTMFILTKAIPKLLKFAARNPLIAAGLVAGGAALGAYLWNKNEEDKQVKKEAEKRNVPEETIRREIDQERDSIVSAIGDAFGSLGGGLALSGGGALPNLGTDTIPAMLTPGEFVMSKGAVDKIGVNNLMGLNAAAGGTNKPKFIDGITYAAGGGPIGSAMHHLQKDEGLSSLTKGRNDFIKPGGISVVSNTPWSSVKPQTPIHAYNTGVSGDRATIGWGSTFYDSILSGRKPVRPGDQVTKAEADNILKVNLISLQNTYKSRIPLWKNMSDKQRAGLLVFGYNAPTAPIGTYPSLTKALLAGDMVSAAKNIERSGPNAERIALEKSLLLDGPKDLTKVQPEKAKAKAKPPAGPKGLVQSLTDTQGLSGIYMRPINAIFGNQSSAPNLQKNVSQMIPGAPTTGSSKMITLPPIAQSVGGDTQLPPSNTTEPSFPSRSAFGITSRSKKLETYGVIG